VIGKETPSPSGRDKTSLFFSLSDRPGALYEVLRAFAERRINLTKIESRPAKSEPWRYLFFLDCEGHVEDAALAECLEEVRRHCLHLEWLGSYPRGDL